MSDNKSHSFEVAKTRADKLRVKGKEFDFKELPSMEPDGGVTNIRLHPNIGGDRELCCRRPALRGKSNRSKSPPRRSLPEQIPRDGQQQELGVTAAVRKIMQNSYHSTVLAMAQSARTSAVTSRLY